MTTATEVQEVSALLEKAAESATAAAVALCDVVELCTTEANGQTLPLLEARALLGQASLTRRWAEWSVEACDKAIKELGDQVCFAEEERDDAS